MESIDLELGELFDRDAVDEDDDDIGALPETADENRDGTGNEEEGDEVLSNLQKLAKGAAKKKVLRPQPKLDAQRLKSDRGLPCLPDLFKDVKFAGKGHEAEDLKLLLSKLEHWAHRLFPKMSFVDFTERLEKLGAKKEIQTCVKRIRLGMSINDSDYITADGPDADEENAMDAEAAYDAMIGDDMANQWQQQRSSDVESDENGEISQGRVNNLSAMSNHGVFSATQSSQNTTIGRPSLSSEQQMRIEQNRLLAMQKRAARLGLSSPSVNSTPTSSVTESASAQSRPHTTDDTSVHERCDETCAEPAADDSTEQNPSGSSEPRETVTSSDEVMQTADEILDDLESDGD